MSPETYNRVQNSSQEDFDRFLDWLFSQTLGEVRGARGDGGATRAAWIRFFRRGLAAGLLLDELMTHVPELFRRAQYSDDDGPKVQAMLKQLNLAQLGVGVQGKSRETGA